MSSGDVLGLSLLLSKARSDILLFVSPPTISLRHAADRRSLLYRREACRAASPGVRHASCLTASERSGAHDVSIWCLKSQKPVRAICDPIPTVPGLVTHVGAM